MAGLTQLKELRLAQTKVKGPSLAPFVKLEDLDLSYSPFDDEGMRYLSGLKELKHLALRDTLVTDEGLKHIAGLTKLEVLDLYGAKLTDAGLKQLSNLTHLQKLNVLGSSITDQGLDALAGMSELQELNLYRSQITNAGLAKLQRLKKLTDLDLRYTRATGSGVEAIRRALPKPEYFSRMRLPRLSTQQRGRVSRRPLPSPRLRSGLNKSEAGPAWSRDRSEASAWRGAGSPMLSCSIYFLSRTWNLWT